MNDLGTYLIQLGGQMDENEVNVMSPFQMTLEQVNYPPASGRASGFTPAPTALGDESVTQLSTGVWVRAVPALPFNNRLAAAFWSRS